MRLLAPALLLLSCVSLPHATPADVARARRTWPQADLATLEAARSTYVARCSGCHLLYVPAEREPRQWPADLLKMSKKAKLKPAELEQIERFVTVMAEHAEPP